MKQKEDILLFDRGAAASFAEFEEQDYKFITRISVNRKYKIISTNSLTEDNGSKNYRRRDCKFI